MSEHDHEHVHGEDCGCEDEPTFVVTDEEGVDREMMMVMTFESENRHYAVLIDKNDPEADGIIFRIEEENEEVYLVSIDDDAEWEAALATYNEIAENEEA